MTGEAVSLVWDMQKTETLNDEYEARLKGHFILCPKKFALYFANSYWEYGKLYLTATLPRSLVKITPGLRSKHWYWVRMNEHLNHGCLCAAVVLDRSRRLIGVLTNLVNTGDPRHDTPVLKILEDNLQLIDELGTETGKRFAAASLYGSYQSNERAVPGRWADFVPFIVDFFAADPCSCKQAMDLIAPEDWVELDEAAALVKKHYGDFSPGLYELKELR